MTNTNERSADQGCCGPGCCDGESKAAAKVGTSGEKSAATGAVGVHDAIRGFVREGYSKIAQVGGWSEAGVGVGSGAPAATETKGACCAGGGCCGPATFSPEQLAQAIGYATGELAAVPEGANMGLSCGNPTAIASLKAGEIVLDLGSGGGFDCFIAGPKVGASGRVIGVDMTPDMLSKARGEHRVVHEADRAGQRRVSPGRDREPASRGQER